MHGLLEAGIRPEVACGPGDWLPRQLAGLATVTVVPSLGRKLSPVSDLRSLMALIALARGSDLVHTHSAKAGFLGRTAAFLARRPSLHTSHGSFLAEPMSPIRRAILRAAERMVAGRTAHLFVLSHADLDLLRRTGLYLMVASSLIRVATERIRHPTGVWTSPAGVPVVITVANFYPSKSVDLLISAFVEVQRQISGVQLMIVGDGPDRKALVAQADRVPGHAIRFVGRVEDPSAALLSSRIFVLSSRKEGVPLALLEALALGVPCVATAVGGVPEHVHEDEAVLVAPNVGALAHAMVELLREPDRAADLGFRGRRAAERYVRASTLGPLIAAYRAAVSASR